ncbi:hypothetical protein QYF61_027760 [Mycteria americana]|uniref:Uncharacterized protein n=1 Tax=Mycteria americana TaxID=33587 RepID=A0AAN7P0H6_MYCAM|nr:hypothetical protein QYF61_027760 [Mycteria americana]
MGERIGKAKGKEGDGCVLRNRAYLTTPNMRNSKPLAKSLREPHAGSATTQFNTFLPDMSPSVSALWKGMRTPSSLSDSSTEYEDFGGTVKADEWVRVLKKTVFSWIRYNSPSFLQGWLNGLNWKHRRIILQCCPNIIQEISITESQNRIGWKRPLRSSSPTVNLTLPSPPLNHVPKHLVQTSLQGWRLNHFPGQPVPMLDNPFGEVKFPNIQSKPPLAQLEAISSHPITCYLGEETDPHLTTASFQGVVESNKVSPQPPFLQAKQPQFPQPLLIRLLLQTLHQLCCPSLDSLQHLHVSLVVRGPKLNTAFEVRPHQCPVQGHDHFPSPAGHTISDTSQDAVGLLGHLGTLPAHIQAAVNQHPQVLFCWAAFQPLFPKPVALHGVVVTQVQDPALGLVEPHTIGLGPSIQPVQSLPTLKQINTPAQLGVICKLAEGALDPRIQIIDKDIKQNWPQHRAMGDTTCDRLPTGFNSIHHHSLGPAVQPVLYQATSTPIQAMSSQFLQENAVGDRVKGFTEV